MQVKTNETFVDIQKECRTIKAICAASVLGELANKCSYWNIRLLIAEFTVLWNMNIVSDTV